jgi:hypothetical protein
MLRRLTRSTVGVVLLMTGMILLLSLAVNVPWLFVVVMLALVVWKAGV